MGEFLTIILFVLLVGIGIMICNSIFAGFMSTDVKKFSDEKKIELMLKMKERHQENTGFQFTDYASEDGIIGRQFYTIFSMKAKEGLLKVMVLKQTFLTIPMYSIVYHLVLDDRILATVDTPTWDRIIEELKK